jgi:subtilase family serine protease
MKRFPISRCAASVGIAGIVFAGCGGPVSPIVAPVAPDSPTTHAARKACPQVQRGEPECLALILDAKGRAGISGWGPSNIQARYKLPSKTNGSGQVVALVDAGDNPDVAGDIANYRSQFGLPGAKFHKYNQEGQQKNYPSYTGWSVEIDLDAEMVSATCPLCTIYLIEANTSESSDLEAAELEAVKLGAHVVSNSWLCEGSLTCVDQRDFDTPGVTYLGASGDGGSSGTGAPAAFGSVAAIGGTVLSQKGSKYREVAFGASGGGCVTGIEKPKWQHDTFCASRLANDAAAVAWNVAEYDSFDGGWFAIGGTSVSTPLLAGVFGLAGNGAKQNGGRTFWQKAHHKYLYPISDDGCAYSNGRYNTCTGWGTPDGIAAF